MEVNGEVNEEVNGEVNVATAQLHFLYQKHPWRGIHMES